MRKSTNYKKSLKPIILAEAQKCFCKYGIRAVTMDTISKNLNISKRTVYELFETKAEILQAVVESILKQRKEYFEDFVQTHESVFDILLEVLRLQLEASVNTHADFFNDLQQYPEIQKVLNANAKKQHEKSVEFFKKGVEQGYFVPEVNYEIFLHITKYSMEMVRTHKGFQRYSYQELFTNFLYVVIRGICTDLGRKKIDEFYDNIKWCHSQS